MKEEIFVRKVDELTCYIDTGQPQNELQAGGVLLFPIVRFVSLKDNVLRVPAGGECVGCKSVHLRNICNL